MTDTLHDEISRRDTQMLRGLIHGVCEHLFMEQYGRKETPQLKEQMVRYSLTEVPFFNELWQSIIGLNFPRHPSEIAARLLAMHGGTSDEVVDGMFYGAGWALGADAALYTPVVVIENEEAFGITEAETRVVMTPNGEAYLQDFVEYPGQYRWRWLDESQWGGSVKVLGPALPEWYRGPKPTHIQDMRTDVERLRNGVPSTAS